MSPRTLDFSDIHFTSGSVRLTADALKRQSIMRGDYVDLLGHLVMIDDVQPVGDPYAPNAYDVTFYSDFVEEWSSLEQPHFDEEKSNENSL